MLAKRSNSTAARLFARTRGLDLEGGLSKVRNFRYASRRSNHWLKKTRAQRETLSEYRA